MRKTLIYVLLLISMFGCRLVVLSSPSPPPTPSADLKASVLPTQEPKKDNTQMTQPPPSSSGMESAIQKAKEDLAQRLSIEISQINLVEAREVVWSNASLGCPQPGMAYAEMLTPGFLILLEGNSIKYEYHASRGTEVIYCENPMPPVEGTPIDQ